MTARTLKLLCGALLVGLVLTGCKPMQIPLKPTPTAVPAASGTAQPGAKPPAAGQPSGRIITEGRVVPAQTASLGFASGGILAQARAKVGDQVTAGQILAQLDTSVLELQLGQAEANLAGARARLAQLDRVPAEEDVAAAKQAVASAKASYDKIVAGPSAAEIEAAKGAVTAAQQNLAQVRAGPSVDEITQLQLGVANAKAVLEQAQAAYDQVKDSANVAMLPQSLALQQATNAYSAANAAYKAGARHPTAAELAAALAQVQAAQAGLDKLTPDPAQAQAALAAVEMAKAHLAELQRQAPAQDLAVLQAELQGAQVGRDLADVQLKNATLVAQFAGTVMKLDVAPGEYAAPGAQVVLLSDTSNWRIETTGLTELNVAEVSEGAPTAITFDAIPGLELTGHVSTIEPYGETKQGDIVYTVNVALDQQDPRLRSNMTAKVRIG